jgi:histidinol-phosphate aminotransferase
MTISVKNLVPEEIAALVPYPPGKPIEEVEREYGIEGSIKLASNENPLGPSPKAVEAITDGMENLHRYPDGSGYYLKRKLSKHLGVEPEMIILGNGSNEIIEFAIRTFLSPGDEVVMANPSFAVYPIVVKATRGKAVEVPLKGLTHDLDAMLKAVTERTRLIFIANPNNPTGTMVTGSALGSFMNSLPEGIVVVIDEAYREYVTDEGYPDALGYVKGGKLVVVLRTFSKIYGLAGLRIGYGVADREVVSYMERVRQPFNVNSLAQIAAMAALDDRSHLERSCENNRRGMSQLFEEIGAMGIECVPSQANFFLIKVGRGRDVYEGLLRRGVIVRPMESYNLPEYIRVTVGLPEENKRFLETFKVVMGEIGG